MPRYGGKHGWIPPYPHLGISGLSWASKCFWEEKQSWWFTWIPVWALQLEMSMWSCGDMNCSDEIHNIYIYIYNYVYIQLCIYILTSVYIQLRVYIYIYMHMNTHKTSSLTHHMWNLCSGSGHCRRGMSCRGSRDGRKTWFRQQETTVRCHETGGNMGSPLKTIENYGLR